MDRIDVALLGHPVLHRGGEPVTLATRKALLLLARLAIEGPQTRESLVALLWPEADDRRGRANLRRTLAYLRDGFGRDLEVVVGAGGSLRLGPGVETDVGAVRRALERPGDAAGLAGAIAAWRGPLMDGINADGEELDAWLAGERELWHQRLALACERHVAQRSEAGDAAGALACVERWLARDPLAETAHRERIRLHLARGDRAAALEAYRHCSEVLERELGISPAPATERLAVIARQAGGAGARAPVPLPAPPEVPMVGREAEHARLAAAYRRAASGLPELTVVSGEPGIGKTRLVTEFARWAEAKGADVVAMRAFPSGRRLAYQPLAAVMAEVFAGPAASRAGAGGPGDGDARLFDAAGRFLAGRALRAPVLLVVDDLAWVDPDSLELLAFVAASLGRSRARLHLLVTARDEELAASTVLRDWIARAVRELALTEIVLPPLTHADAQRLVDLWPQKVGEPAGELVRHAGGRPLVLVESLRFLATGGDPAALAPAARVSMVARLGTLGPDAAALASAAAVLERPCQLATLAAVAGIDPGPPCPALDELLERHVLAGAGAYAFSHELLRRAAEASLTPETRRTLHARAARSLDADPGGSAAEVAQHAELAGSLDLAWGKRMQAGREAMAMPAYRAAIDHFRAAIAIRPEPDRGAAGAEPGDAWLLLGRAEELSGRSDLAQSTYRMLAARARTWGRASDEAAALVRLAELAGRDLAAGPPVALFEEAAEAASESGDPVLALEADLTAAQVDAYRGELARARARAEAAHEVAGRIGRPELVARCLNLRAFVSQSAGNWHEALGLARAASAAYRALGDTVMRLDSTGYEVAALVFLGRWREALPKARRARAEAERLANPWAVSNLSLVEAWAERDGGRLREALATASRGAAMAVEAGFTPLQVLNGTLAGRCRRELGDLQGALFMHEGMLAIAERLEGPAYQCVAEDLCSDHARAGDWDAAGAWAGRVFARWGESRMFTCLSLWDVARACRRAGIAFWHPPLPTTERYRLVGLRTEAVLAEFAGEAHEAERARRGALAIARRLGLAIEGGELRSELDAGAGGSVG